MELLFRVVERERIPRQLGVLAVIEHVIYGGKNEMRIIG